MTPNPEPPNKINRLKEDYDAREKIRKLRREKRDRLSEALVYENNEAAKLQLEHQIQDEETKLKDIENKLSEIEQKLQKAGSKHQQNDETQQNLPNKDISEIDREIEQAEAEVLKIEQAKTDLPKPGKHARRSYLWSHLHTSNNRKIIIFPALILCGVSVVFLLTIFIPDNPDVCKFPAADVSSIDFSPNGKFLATASLDNTVRILKVTETTDDQTNSVDCQLNADGVDGVVAVKFSPDGTYLATASLDSASLWKVKDDGSIGPNSYQNLSHNTILPNNTEYKKSVVAIDFSQDGKYLVTASADGEIKVWNMKNLKDVKALSTPQGQPKAYIVSVSFSHDGNYIATTDVNGIANVWELKADDITFTPKWLKNIQNVTDIAFSLQDGNKRNLVTASADGTIQVWDISNFHKKPVTPFKGSITYVMNVSFSLGGKFLAAISLDQKAYIWDWNRQQTISLLEGLNTNVTAIAFSSDDKYLAIANTDPVTKVTVVTVLNTTGGGKVVSFTPEGNGLVMVVAFSLTRNNEMYLATATADGKINMRKLPK